MAKDQLDRMLDQWRAERPEIDVSGMELIPRVFRLAYLYDRRLRELSDSLGLRPGWLDVLSALRRIGSPYQLSASKLARWVLLTSGGLTSRVDRMEEAGLVRRQPDRSDRRGVLVELTDAGRELIDVAIDAQVELEKRITPLTGAERRTFVALLRKQLVELEGAHEPGEGEPPTSPPRGR